MYSADNYSIKSYGAMVNDHARCQPFVDALTRLVTPGSVVLDLGTGTGFFALLAVKLGALRVYAIEPDDAIEIGKLCARGLPGSERITWLQGLSTDLELPEKADIIIGDLHGNLPFYNNMIPSLADARRRFLAEGGALLPTRDILRVVPAHAPHEYKELDHPWRENRSDLDLSAGRGFVANSWWRARRDPARSEDLLSTAAVWGVIDFTTAETATLDNSLRFTIERPGTMHGYYVWFDSELAGNAGASNAPDLSELVYGRCFFPLELPVEVAAGDRVDLRLSTKPIDQSQVYRWDSRILDANGVPRAEFRQSTFRSRPIARRDLQRAAANHRPVLNLDGMVDHAVIQAMAASETLGQIAERLAARFPQRFATPAKALDHVAKLSKKYSSGIDRASAHE